MIINEGFQPKRQKDDRLPPGQYETRDFPVLSLGPTPDIDIDKWSLEVSGLVKNPIQWNWKEFNKLPKMYIRRDIHCVTKWSKFDTDWEVVPMDEIMRLAGLQTDIVTTLIAHSYDGYTTNIPIEDVTNGKAFVAVKYQDEEIPPEHGGPARLFVPHLYFWKSAKWLNKLEFVGDDQPGFWETRGYHNYGDPWKEQRYTFD